MLLLVLSIPAEILRLGDGLLVVVIIIGGCCSSSYVPAGKAVSLWNGRSSPTKGQSEISDLRLSRAVTYQHQNV